MCTDGEEVGDDPPWAAWHPTQVADRLAGVRAPWCVAAGWALDLFRGEQTRAHSDLEIAVPAGGFAEVRAALADLDFHVVGSGRRWPLDSDAFDVHHQTWAFDPTTGVYCLDVFRDPHDGDIWVCKRDASIRLPYAQMVHRAADGTPYQSPEVVLLFKAKHSRPKDHADFTATLPLLDPAQREWLEQALRQVHPGHEWLDAL